MPYLKIIRALPWRLFPCFKGALGFVGGYEFLMLFHAGPIAQLLFGFYLAVSSCYTQAPRLIPKCCEFFNKRKSENKCKR